MKSKILIALMSMFLLLPVSQANNNFEYEMSLDNASNAAVMTFSYNWGAPKSNIPVLEEFDYLGISEDAKPLLYIGVAILVFASWFKGDWGR